MLGGCRNLRILNPAMFAPKREILKFHSFLVLFCQMQPARFNLIKF
ncbi:hypothetical protein CAMGR0001_0229 [Campylobacter gracilis RM3268]|uniref:Uncharacterized protein n=1 Tax=Campylobacter gracilis RM3268 TaxID=553220 RepID=C8PKK7_9BACT|nr:hypothetical protein CAMGR0001_0229 [Campylobacter gracilis RM3268]